jgi:hypothetical protein
MNKVFLGVLGIAFTLIFFSCSDSENEVIFDRSEVIRLLSIDSSKLWIRNYLFENGQSAEIEECSLKTIINYKIRRDSLIYTISTSDQYCNTIELLDSGLWDVLEDGSFTGRIDKIVYYSGEDSTVKKILEITSLRLGLEGFKEDSQYEEIFESDY